MKLTKLVVGFVMMAVSTLPTLAEATDTAVSAGIIPSGGYQTCSVPSDRVASGSGAERPLD